VLLVSKYFTSLEFLTRFYQRPVRKLVNCDLQYKRPNIYTRYSEGDRSNVLEITGRNNFWIKVRLRRTTSTITTGKKTTTKNMETSTIWGRSECDYLLSLPGSRILVNRDILQEFDVLSIRDYVQFKQGM
jgi:hypothetical protein